MKVPSHHILDDEEESNAPPAGGVRRKKVVTYVERGRYVIWVVFPTESVRNTQGEEGRVGRGGERQFDCENGATDVRKRRERRVGGEGDRG